MCREIVRASNLLDLLSQRDPISPNHQEVDENLKVHRRTGDWPLSTAAGRQLRYQLQSCLFLMSLEYSCMEFRPNSERASEPYLHMRSHLACSPHDRDVDISSHQQTDHAPLGPPAPCWLEAAYTPRPTISLDSSAPLGDIEAAARARHTGKTLRLIRSQQAADYTRRCCVSTTISFES